MVGSECHHRPAPWVFGVVEGGEAGRGRNWQVVGQSEGQTRLGHGWNQWQAADVGLLSSEPAQTRLMWSKEMFVASSYQPGSLGGILSGDAKFFSFVPLPFSIRLYFQ